MRCLPYLSCCSSTSEVAINKAESSSHIHEENLPLLAAPSSTRDKMPIWSGEVKVAAARPGHAFETL